MPNQKAGPTPARAHFYYPVRHRYPRRQIKEILGLIGEFSEPDFTHAVGHYGEMLMSNGFAEIGFRILQRRVKSVDGKVWSETNHDLDFLVIRDGIRYGVEVKNTLGYIDQTEYQVKMNMCKFFGVRPMFVCRRTPGSYMYEIYRAGGYGLMTINQDYPLLAKGLAKRVRERLRLPVGVIQRFPDTALLRFQEFHERVLAGSNA